ncbi:hypothetical protein [Streptomyces axinellae]|uniref:Uncharacterized protein n=1 Tax=Streptomyces axinellae TaxID=552788 RepID=A0ABP6CV78_9ACTN
MPDDKNLLREAVNRNAYQKSYARDPAAHEAAQAQADQARAAQEHEERERVARNETEVQNHLARLRAERQGETQKSAAAQDISPQDFLRTMEEKEPMKALEEAEIMARKEEDVALDICDKLLDSPLSDGQHNPAEDAANIRADRAGEVAKAWSQLKEYIRETREVAADVAAYEASEMSSIPFSTWEEVRADEDMRESYEKARELQRNYLRVYGTQQPVASAPESVVQAARASRQLTLDQPGQKPVSPGAAQAKPTGTVPAKRPNNSEPGGRLSPPPRKR